MSPIEKSTLLVTKEIFVEDLNISHHYSQIADFGCIIDANYFDNTFLYLQLFARNGKWSHFFLGDSNHKKYKTS